MNSTNDDNNDNNNDMYYCTCSFGFLFCWKDFVVVLDDDDGLVVVIQQGYSIISFVDIMSKSRQDS